MAMLKQINISSNGSFYFCYNLKTSIKLEQIIFQKTDDKNFKLNKKNNKNVRNSKFSSIYKKKYLI